MPESWWTVKPLPRVTKVKDTTLPLGDVRTVRVECFRIWPLQVGALANTAHQVSTLIPLGRKNANHVEKDCSRLRQVKKLVILARTPVVLVLT